MSNHGKKNLLGIALIGIGVFMLFSMIGTSFARTRAYHARIAAVEAAAAQQATSAEGTETQPTSKSTQPARSGRGHYRGHRAPFTPFIFMAGLFKLFSLGIIAFFIYRFLKVRKHRGRDPVAKIVDDDDVEGDIRVGDEINHESGAIDPEDMSVDDLVRAMKRLGIKKLEL